MPRALLFCVTAAAWAQPKPFGQMVNLGGHGVHLHCEGDGPATVLLLHGTPRFSFHFALIWPKVAEFARVCVYDRAGDAWSEPVPGQPTAEIFVEELDRVVRHISPQRPVVLAGHSVGGVLARAYYARYPARVAAMVLIDTAPLLPAFVEATDETLRELAKKPRPPAPKAALAPPFDRLPTGFHEAHLWATDKWQAYAAGVDRFQALKYQADLYKLAAKATGSTLPVWFLIRAEQDIGAPWPNAKLVRVAASSHDIQLDQPDAVVGAIREAVRSAAADGK